MPSVPPEGPGAAYVNAAANDVLAAILVLLVKSGCSYMEEHPEVRIKIGGLIEDDRISVDLAYQDCEDER